MILTREKALELHRQMWGDMQKELGDCPKSFERRDFKGEWCKEHFPNERIEANCFLCEFAKQVAPDDRNICRFCPISWETWEGNCYSIRKIKPTTKWKAYLVEPISWILKQKEKVEE